MEKRLYETPQVEVMELVSEGVLCASGAGTGSFNDYDDPINW